MKTLIHTLIAIFLFLPALVFSQAGTLDSSFSKDGKTITAIRGVYDIGAAVAIQPDGKIIVAGSSSNGVYYKSDFGLIRYKTNGTPDNSFGTSGRAVTDFGGDRDNGNSVVIQPDGKIIVAGTTTHGFTKHFALARYNNDGSPDSSFDNDGKLTTDFGNNNFDNANAVVLQPDGKILVAGNSFGDLELARYKPNGALDNSFGVQGKVITSLGDAADAYAAVIRPNGKIVVAGGIIQYGSSSIDFMLVQYLSNGTVDSAFGINGKAITDLGGVGEAHSIALLPNGKLLAAGDALNGITYNFALLRYSANGVPDSSFGNNGKVITSVTGNDEGKAVVVQPDGKIIVSGNAPHIFELVRYKPNGKLDKSFGASGIVLTDFGDSDLPDCISGGAIIQPDGKIVTAGSVVDESTPESELAVARYNGDASLVNNEKASFVKIEAENKSSIKIYPNPVQSVLNIQFNKALSSSPKTINIFNVDGRLLLTKSAQGNMQLDVKQLTAGTYLIKINDESGKVLYNGKVVKQ